MGPNISGNFQVCISVPLIIAKWRPGLRVRDSVYSEAGPRGTIRVGWLNLQPLKWLFGASAWWFLVGRACWAGRAFSWAWVAIWAYSRLWRELHVRRCYLYSSGFASLWLPPIVVSVGAPKYFSIFPFNEFRNYPKMLVIITVTFDIFLLMVLI